MCHDPLWTQGITAQVPCTAHSCNSTRSEGRRKFVGCSCVHCFRRIYTHVGLARNLEVRVAVSWFTETTKWNHHDIKNGLLRSTVERMSLPCTPNHSSPRCTSSVVSREICYFIFLLFHYLSTSETTAWYPLCCLKCPQVVGSSHDVASLSISFLFQGFKVSRFIQ